MGQKRGAEFRAFKQERQFDVEYYNVFSEMSTPNISGSRTRV